MLLPRLRTLVRLAVILSLAVVCIAPVAGSAPGVLYFPVTGHSISGEFQQFWQATPRALYTLGYPISEPFIQESSTEPGVFYRVQYFERTVLEEHLQPGRSVMVLGRLLGRELANGRDQEAAFLPVSKPRTGEHWDNITRHTIANVPAPFRRFYDEGGGLRVFGRPLSEQFQERNSETGQIHWVQYFERQRMEWHPEASDPAFAVMLGRLGEEYRQAHPDRVDQRAFQPSGGAQARRRRIEYGINATLLYGDYGRALDLSDEAGLGWVRQQVHWKDHQSRDGRISWGELDTIVIAAEARGIKLLLSVLQAPDWATRLPGIAGLPDRAYFGQYAAFLGEMAKRYRGRVHAYQIWNEINLAPENGIQGVPETDYYVDLLVPAYSAIKAGDPDALVVSSGLAPSEWHGDPGVAIGDLLYFRALFSDPRFWQHVDVVGVHVFGCANPPETLWPSRPGPGPGWTTSREFYFRRIEDVREEIVKSGHGERQIWITEFGWALPNDTPGHEFGHYNSPVEQAEYLVRAFDMGAYDYAPWIGAMFAWNLNFSVAWQTAGNPLHQMAAYSVLNADWSPRPAYLAIRDMPKP